MTIQRIKLPRPIIPKNSPLSEAFGRMMGDAMGMPAHDALLMLGIREESEDIQNNNNTHARHNIRSTKEGSN